MSYVNTLITSPSPQLASESKITYVTATVLNESISERQFPNKSCFNGTTKYEALEISAAVY
jgi:hypothetical protein